jgi:hypothetical protein
MAILRQFEKFGANLKKNFQTFGVKAGKDLSTAGKFIAKKALPVIQEVVGGIGKAAALAAPLLLYSGVGAEFAPIALGVAAGAKATEFAIASGRKIAKAAQAAQAAKAEAAKAAKVKAIRVAGEPPMAIASTIEKQTAMPIPIAEVRGAFGTSNEKDLPIAYPVSEVRGAFGT